MEIKIVFEILARRHVDSSYFKGLASRRLVAGESPDLAGLRSPQPAEQKLRVWNPQHSSRYRKVKCKRSFLLLHLFQWLLSQVQMLLSPPTNTQVGVPT